MNIRKSKKLTARDVSLPFGPIPTELQWEEYLNRKTGKGKPARKVFSDIKKRLIEKYSK